MVKANEFKSGVVFDKTLFGSLSLVECSSLKSKIVNAQQYAELFNVYLKDKV